MKLALALAVLSAIFAPEARAVTPAECDKLTTGLTLCLPRVGTDFDQWATAEINLFTMLNSSALPYGSTAPTTVPLIIVSTMSGLNGSGIFVSSYTRFGSSINVMGAATFGSSLTINSGVGVNGALTMGGASAYIVSGSSITGGYFSGNGAGLSGVVAAPMTNVPIIVATATVSALSCYTFSQTLTSATYRLVMLSTSSSNSGANTEPEFYLVVNGDVSGSHYRWVTHSYNASNGVGTTADTTADFLPFTAYDCGRTDGSTEAIATITSGLNQARTTGTFSCEQYGGSNEATGTVGGVYTSAAMTSLGVCRKTGTFSGQLRLEKMAVAP